MIEKWNKKATGVAKAMQEQFGEQLVLRTCLASAPEAAGYALKGSTNIFVNGAWVALDVATDREKMAAYLAKVLARSG